MQQYLQNKKGLVQSVFDLVYDRYDLMNDFMSLGIHRLWKKNLLNMMNPSLNNKLIDVVKVLDLNDGKHIERELMLVKVKASHQYREEMKRISDIFRGRIIDVSDNTFTIEITGSSTKLDAYLDSLDKSAIVETVRTGASGIGRGDRILKI